MFHHLYLPSCRSAPPAEELDENSSDAGSEAAHVVEQPVTVECRFPAYADVHARRASFLAADVPTRQLPGVQVMAEANLFWPPTGALPGFSGPVCYICGAEVLGMKYESLPSTMHWCQPRNRKRSAKAAASDASAQIEFVDGADEEAGAAGGPRKRRKATAARDNEWCVFLFCVVIPLG